MTQIQRDPFSRATLYRELVPPEERKSCAWCGQPARFRYGWQEDAINTRTPYMPRQFCSVSCWRAYSY